MLRCALVCLGICVGLSAHAQEEAIIPSDIGARVVEEYAAPALAAFANATDHLKSRIEVLCRQPEQEALAATRTAFAAVVRAWGPVSLLRFGPLVEENRFEHLFFWPDPRGVTLRQVQGLLAEQDEAAATTAGLKQKSVALQGLPALEYALFGSGSEALVGGETTYRCRYAAALASNAAERAAALANAWAPGAAFHQAFTHPSEHSALYRSPAEVAGEIVDALGTGLQFTRDAELLPALGASVERANGRRSPFWRSGLTFDLVGAQIRGMIALLEAADFKRTLAPARAAIVDSVLFDLEHALKAIQAVRSPAEIAFADAGDRSRIAYATVALTGANRAIGEELAAAIGLRMGFNALDGD